ncbi:AtpZ/AtpI family protein [Flavitalea flava]
MESAGNDNKDHAFSDEVAKKENRKLKALRENNGVWFGLGMMGMVGWSVAVPSLLGAALGLWLDKRHPQSFSWTLSLLIVGVISGCIMAWYWVIKEDKGIHNNNKDDNDG